jgi:hypothetical protein
MLSPPPPPSLSVSLLFLCTLGDTSFSFHVTTVLFCNANSLTSCTWVSTSAPWYHESSFLWFSPSLSAHLCFLFDFVSYSVIGPPLLGFECVCTSKFLMLEPMYKVTIKWVCHEGSTLQDVMSTSWKLKREP